MAQAGRLLIEKWRSLYSLRHRLLVRLTDVVGTGGVSVQFVTHRWVAVNLPKLPDATLSPMDGEEVASR